MQELAFQDAPGFLREDQRHFLDADNAKPTAKSSRSAGVSIMTA